MHRIDVQWRSQSYEPKGSGYTVDSVHRDKLTLAAEK